MRDFATKLARLRIAAEGRGNLENKGRMLTDTSNGGVDLVFVRVADLRQLLYHFDRLDTESRDGHV